MDVSQGEQSSSTAYNDGCDEPTKCASPRTQTQRLTVRGGCSPIRVRFVDVGAELKWLHVAARRVTQECQSDPEYPSCNRPADSDGGNARRRALLATTSDLSISTNNKAALTAGGSIAAADHGLLFGTEESPIISQHHRALLLRGKRSVGEAEEARDRRVGEGGGEGGAAGTGGSGSRGNGACEPNGSDEEDAEPGADIDEPIERACSVFTVRCWQLGETRAVLCRCLALLLHCATI